MKMSCFDCSIKLSEQAKRCDNCRRYKALDKKLAKVCHSAVNVAIKRGEMTKPSTCEQCFRPPINAHHTDYSDPYKVNWLCKYHHTQEHKKLDSYVWASTPRP